MPFVFEKYLEYSKFIRFFLFCFFFFFVFLFFREIIKKSRLFIEKPYNQIIYRLRDDYGL